MGTHLLFYSADPEADRAFMRNTLDLACIDTGGGWLIFSMPTTEAGVHPMEGPNMPPAAAAQGTADGAASGADGEGSGSRFMIATVWMMVEDIAAARAELEAKGVATAEPVDEGWGIHTAISLPSGAQLGLYQPLHPTALGL